MKLVLFFVVFLSSHTLLAQKKSFFKKSAVVDLSQEGASLTSKKIIDALLDKLNPNFEVKDGDFTYDFLESSLRETIPAFKQASKSLSEGGLNLERIIDLDGEKTGKKENEREGRKFELTVPYFSKKKSDDPNEVREVKLVKPKMKQRIIIKKDWRTRTIRIEQLNAYDVVIMELVKAYSGIFNKALMKDLVTIVKEHGSDPTKIILEFELKTMTKVTDEQADVLFKSLVEGSKRSARDFLFKNLD